MRCNMTTEISLRGRRQERRSDATPGYSTWVLLAWTKLPRTDKKDSKQFLSGVKSEAAPVSKIRLEELELTVLATS
jgi:hypothetical protein